MAAGAPGVGGEGHLSVVAGAAVFTLIEALHGEVAGFFSRPRRHFKEALVTVIAGKPLIHMLLVVEDNGLNGFGKDNHPSVLLLLGLCLPHSQQKTTDEEE